MNFNQTLRNSIASAVNTPADPRISGAILQEQLLSVVNALDTGAKYMGVATPSTVPTTEANCFFLTSQEGTYANFTDTGGKAIVVNQGELAVIRSVIYQDNLRWQKATLFTGGGGSAQLAVSITYAALKALRDGGNLVPGTWYRITDYACSTTQENTQSANHAFDIIVRADDSSHLNENGYAAHHHPDNTISYQILPNENLNFTYPAWMREKPIDSALGDFVPVNGDTIVLHNSENTSYEDGEWLGDFETLIPGTEYRFKSRSSTARTITFSDEDYFAACKLEAWELKYSLDNDTNRFAWADEENGTGVVYWMKDEWDNEAPYDFKNIKFSRTLTNGAYDDHGTAAYVYTFNSYTGGTNSDATVLAATNNKIRCCNNVIYERRNTNSGDYKLLLNDNVFLNVFTNNTGYTCSGNKFGINCQTNTFGNSCSYNTFGNNCSYNTFGNNCGSNSFGNNCSDNTFGNSCGENTFGNSCYNNSFGNNCQLNTFGNGCGNNTFGNSCQQNTFGNYCSSNMFGNDCNNNTFGNICSGNSFGNYCYCIVVSNGAEAFGISTGSDSHPVRFCQVLGANYGGKTPLDIPFVADCNYTQIAGLDNNGNLVIFNPAVTHGS